MVAFKIATIQTMLKRFGWQDAMRLHEERIFASA